MATLREQIDAVIAQHPGWDQHQIAQAMIREVVTAGPEAIEELLAPSLAGVVWQRLRARMRGAEEAVFEDIRKGKDAAGTFAGYHYDPLEDFGRLLDHHFKIKGRTVRYRDATVTDWVERKSVLEQRQVKLQDQVAACDTALKLLQRHKAATLGEAWEKSTFKKPARRPVLPTKRSAATRTRAP